MSTALVAAYACCATYAFTVGQTGAGIVWAGLFVFRLWVHTREKRA
jgi:hypothetical protein